VVELVVKGLDKREWGSSIVRLHYSYRDGIGRYGVARITNSATPSNHSDAVLLGYDDDKSIYMAYDTRKALGVKKGQKLDFELKELGWLEKVKWYLNTPDPRVYVPAWLAVWSIGLGAAGIIFGLFSLFL
jgi:hypothetical protein